MVQQLLQLQRFQLFGVCCEKRTNQQMKLQLQRQLQDSGWNLDLGHLWNGMTDKMRPLLKPSHVICNL